MPYQLGVDGLGSSLSIGEVKQVHPATYTASVYIRAGDRKGVSVECQIRSLSKNDSSRTGIIFMPDYGDLVHVDWRYGLTPMITDYASELSLSDEDDRAYRATLTPVRTFGGEDKYHSGSGKKNYRWGPNDLMPGDKKIMGKAGNFLGILSGGLTILQAGKLSQIVMSKLGDLVRIVSRNFEVFSDFGIMRMLNDRGVTSFELLGNASGKKSNSHQEGGWDYEMRIGGADLFNLGLGNLFRFRVDQSGAAFFKAKAAVVDLDSPPTINIRGNSNSSIDGHRANTIGGDDWKDIKGTKTEKMSRHAYINSGAHNGLVAGPHTGSYLSTHIESIRGTSLTSISATGKETRVAAGNYNISVGDPLDLGVPAPSLLAQLKTGDFDLKTFSGDITLSATIKGDVELSTLLGDATLKTGEGDLTLSTALGNVDLSTFLGDVDISTLSGNVSASTLLGDLTLETAVGEVNITATAGTINLTAGLSSISIGPAGISIMNAGLDMMTLINTTLTQLGTATMTPGYGAPIANAAAFAALQAQWTLLTGAPP